jgi:hypothetical protein
LVEIRDAKNHVGDALFFVKRKRFADFARPIQDDVRAVEEDGFARNRNNKAAFRRFRRFDVIFAEPDVRVSGSRFDFDRGVGDRRETGDFFAVKTRRDRRDKFR